MLQAGSNIHLLLTFLAVILLALLCWLLLLPYQSGRAFRRIVATFRSAPGATTTTFDPSLACRRDR